MSKAFLDAVTAFAEGTVAPAAGTWSMGQSPDRAIFEQAAKIGVLGMEVPTARGGLGLGFATRTQACAILAGADFGLAMSLVNTHNIALRLCQIAPPEVRDRYLPALLSGDMSACTALTEPGTGSDFAAVTTTARKEGAGWVLNGEKTWIINARHAGLSMVYAQCGPLGDAAGIGAFLVDVSAQGVSRHAIDAGFSQTSLGTGGFHFDQVALPGDAQLIAPGTAFKAILTEINSARTYVAAMCDAMVSTAVRTVETYGANRHSFGKPLSAIPSWQAHLAEAKAALKDAQDTTARAVNLIARGQDAQLAAAQAKISSVTCAQIHLPQLLQLMGAEGLRPQYPFTRHLAAAQIAGFTDGATNILKDRVAKLTAKQRT